MKFGELESIGHNIADSLASGIGLLIGVYATDIFDEAGRSPQRYISVDFLNGTSTGGEVSESLARAIRLYSQGLPDLCRRHGIDTSAFRELTARYSSTWRDHHFAVTVEDQSGRRSTVEYAGHPGSRALQLDHLGRIRPKPAT
jgi:hypothetical protein